MIATLLSDSRKATLARLLTGDKAEINIASRISLQDLANHANDQSYYSLLVQAGYLALDNMTSNKSTTAVVSIPNTELMIVWKDFILEKLYPDTSKIRTLFDNADNLPLFEKDLEYFISDRLSYHDLAVYKGKNKGKMHEQLYHIFVLGMLSAYGDTGCHYPLSNRESGDGRYDILVEKPIANFIFEFKSSASSKNLANDAKKALAQIDAKRYSVGINTDKQLIKVGVTFYGKTCKALCSY